MEMTSISSVAANLPHLFWPNGAKFGPLVAPRPIRRTRIGDRQIDRAPQLRRIGFVGIGGIGAEGRNVEVLFRKGPRPELRIAHRVCLMDRAPELDLRVAQ